MLTATNAIKSPAANTATEQTLKPGSQAFNAIFGQNTAAVSGGKPSSALEAQVDDLEEVGADEEAGLGEEETLAADAGAQSATSGLVGASAAAGVGAGGLAASGAAVLGLSSFQEDTTAQDGVPFVPPSPIQVAEANSAGINIGPSDDGSLLVSGGKTEVGALGSDKPVATLNGLSILNPNAQLPSGNPITVDPENQVLGINLGPLASTELDLDLNDLTATVMDFAGSVGSLDIELTELLALNIPTSLAGTELPVTDTLNEVLTQLDGALAPVTDALASATAAAPSLDSGLQVLADAPVIGDVLSQVTGVVSGGLPTGELALPITPEIPMTNTPLDLVTGQVTQAIGSLNTGDVPLAGALTGVLPV